MTVLWRRDAAASVVKCRDGRRTFAVNFAKLPELASCGRQWKTRHQAFTEPICPERTQFINLGPATLGRVGPVAIIAFTAFLVGTLLAERFNVLSLLPTTMIALPCAAGLAGGARPCPSSSQCSLSGWPFSSVILPGFAHKGAGPRYETSLFRRWPQETRPIAALVSPPHLGDAQSGGRRSF